MQYLFYSLICLLATTLGAISGIGGGVIIKPVLDATASISVSQISFLSGCSVLAMSIVEICLCNPINWVNYILISGILALVVYAHRKNIERLLLGKESKASLIKKAKKKLKSKNV